MQVVWPRRGLRAEPRHPAPRRAPPRRTPHRRRPRTRDGQVLGGGIGEPDRRFGRSSRGHRAPPDALELKKLSGKGSPGIVAVWFAWWYLRPTLPRR
ncbi:hypothetical protein CA850_10225 [Micromonospora echinospora]|nr:hypothetical protein CA850_10225 [Micromonospora echinospora]